VSKSREASVAARTRVHIPREVFDFALVDVLERVSGDDPFLNLVRPVGDPDDSDVLVKLRKREVLSDPVGSTELQRGVDDFLGDVRCIVLRDGSFRPGLIPVRVDARGLTRGRFRRMELRLRLGDVEPSSLFLRDRSPNTSRSLMNAFAMSSARSAIPENCIDRVRRAGTIRCWVCWNPALTSPRTFSSGIRTSSKSSSV